MIPALVKIGPLVFEVETRDDMDVAGRIDYKPKARVVLCTEFDEQYVLQCLIHEMQHGVYENCGERDLANNEPLVERVSNCWFGALMESPGLLEALIELRDKHTE